MACDDERQQIVTQLGCAHGAACFGVFALKQEIKQIGNIASARAAAGIDGIIGNGFHLLERGACHNTRGTRNPHWQPENIKEREFARGGDIGVNCAVHFVGGKQCAARECHRGGDVKGGAHHLGVNVAGAFVGGFDAGKAGFGGGAHHGGKGAHVTMGKHRRGGAALPAPMRALSDKEALANRGAQKIFGDV